ncbi:hypothetical protein C0J52_24946 [Blattella germanica]|nr:hypothetical protein C0J52_24946 [Blattella germanica]
MSSQSRQLCSIRRETTRFLKNKKREYLKQKINNLEDRDVWRAYVRTAMNLRVR